MRKTNYKELDFILNELILLKRNIENSPYPFEAAGWGEPGEHAMEIQDFNNSKKGIIYQKLKDKFHTSTTLSNELFKVLLVDENIRNNPPVVISEHGIAFMANGGYDKLRKGNKNYDRKNYIIAIIGVIVSVAAIVFSFYK